MVSTAAVAQLRRRLPADLVVTAPEELAAASRLWNAAVTTRPAILVRCRDTADVQLAVRTAREHDLPLSVLGRGHDWAGRALRPGGLVVDVGRLRHVTVDVAGATARVGGGTSSAELAAAAGRHGLTPVTGWRGSAGIVGLSLGGGYGPLCGRAGLAADALVGARVVLADGTVVDTDTDGDLLWALRGAGGNFGVVVEARVALQRVRLLVFGTLTFGWNRARTVMTRLDDLLRSAPDDLTVRCGIRRGADGEPELLVQPAWSGGVNEWMDSPGPVPELATLGRPRTDDVAPGTLSSLLRDGDRFAPPGTHLAVRTRTVEGLNAGTVTNLLEAGRGLTSPSSRIWLHHFHGVADRLDPGSAPPALRAPHLAVEVVAGWQEAGTGALHRAWADRVGERMSWSALPGGSVDLLGADALGQVVDAYGRNSRRLLELKRRYDPTGVFAATPLPTRGTPGDRLEARQEPG